VTKNKNFIEAVRKSPVSVLEGAICFFSIWSILGLAGFHTYLISVNKTTNEDIKVTFSSKRGSGLHNPYTTHNLFTNCCQILCGPNSPSLIDRRSYYDPSSNTFVGVNPETARNARSAAISSDYPYPRQAPASAVQPQPPPPTQLTQPPPNASHVYYGNFCETNSQASVANDAAGLVHGTNHNRVISSSASAGSIKSQMDSNSQLMFSQSTPNGSTHGFDDHFVASAQPPLSDPTLEKSQQQIPQQHQQQQQQNQQLQQQMIQAMHQYVVQQSAV
jgi:hypothetical protein